MTMSKGTASNGYPMGSRIPYKPCGAKKRNGEACRGAAMPNGRCRLHGGKSLAGVMSPRFRHGRYSKHLGKIKHELRAGFKAAATDSELRGLREHAELLDGFILDELRKLRNAEPPPWGDAVEAINDYKTAKSGERKGEAFARLERVIRTGAAAAPQEARIVAKIQELIRDRTKTGAAEWKRQVDLKAVATWDQVMAHAAAVEASAKETITDREQLARFYDKLYRLMRGPKGVQADVEE
jgi:hypothetical protein